MKHYKQILKIIWLLLLLFSLGSYVLFPNLYTAQNFTSFSNENSTQITLLFCLATCIRSLFFIPSTVFVIMGIALFPNQPIFVIIVNIAGVMIGGTILYLAAIYFTKDTIFSSKNESKLIVIQKKMEQHGFWIVLLWSFFPAVPTDLICYVAGSVKMTYFKFIGALFIGELILISFYVYTGKGILEYLV